MRSHVRADNGNDRRRVGIAQRVGGVLIYAKRHYSTSEVVLNRGHHWTPPHAAEPKTISMYTWRATPSATASLRVIRMTPGRCLHGLGCRPKPERKFRPEQHRDTIAASNPNWKMTQPTGQSCAQAQAGDQHTPPAHRQHEPGVDLTARRISDSASQYLRYRQPPDYARSISSINDVTPENTIAGPSNYRQKSRQLCERQGAVSSAVCRAHDRH